MESLPPTLTESQDSPHRDTPYKTFDAVFRKERLMRDCGPHCAGCGPSARRSRSGLEEIGPIENNRKI